MSQRLTLTPLGKIATAFLVAAALVLGILAYELRHKPKKLEALGTGYMFQHGVGPPPPNTTTAVTAVASTATFLGLVATPEVSTPIDSETVRWTENLRSFADIYDYTWTTSVNQKNGASEFCVSLRKENKGVPRVVSIATCDGSLKAAVVFAINAARRH